MRPTRFRVVAAQTSRLRGERPSGKWHRRETAREAVRGRRGRGCTTRQSPRPILDGARYKRAIAVSPRSRRTTPEIVSSKPAARQRTRSLDGRAERSTVPDVRTPITRSPASDEPDLVFLGQAFQTAHRPSTIDKGSRRSEFPPGYGGHELRRKIADVPVADHTGDTGGVVNHSVSHLCEPVEVCPRLP